MTHLARSSVDTIKIDAKYRYLFVAPILIAWAIVSDLGYVSAKLGLLAPVTASLILFYHLFSVLIITRLRYWSILVSVLLVTIVWFIIIEFLSSEFGKQLSTIDMLVATLGICIYNAVFDLAWVAFVNK